MVAVLKIVMWYETQRIFIEYLPKSMAIYISSQCYWNYLRAFTHGAAATAFRRHGAAGVAAFHRRTTAAYLCAPLATTAAVSRIATATLSGPASTVP